METVDISNYLSEHHVRPSYQRTRIFHYLAEKRSHPTIEEIYSALSPDMPSLSKTTVYNTLALFVREGIAKPLSIEENQMRYDADTSLHGHFQCLRCGKVSDFSVDSLSAAGLEEFEVDSRDVFYKGICPACRKG